MNTIYLVKREINRVEIIFDFLREKKSIQSINFMILFALNSLLLSIKRYRFGMILIQCFAIQFIVMYNRKLSNVFIYTIINSHWPIQQFRINIIDSKMYNGGRSRNRYHIHMTLRRG